MRTVMHEWPLVLFTALAVAGGGTLAAQPLLMALGATDVAAARSQAAWATILLVAGLVVSLKHVGQTRRVLLASRRVGVSPLSTEVALAGAAVAAGAALAWWPAGLARTDVVAWSAGLVAASFLLSLGFVYRLGGQVAWPGVAVVGPVVTGLAFGFVTCAATAPATLAVTLGPTLVLLGADALVFGSRWGALATIKPWLSQSHPAIFRHRHLLLLDRLILATLAPAVLLAVGVPALADLSIGLGVLVDRLAFYGLAAQHTTEAEIAFVEDVIEGR
jgi:DMSO reductase anchor subunit